MNPLVLLIAAATIAACGDARGRAAPAPAQPRPAQPRPAEAPATVAATAHEVCQAIARADRDALRAHLLTYDELIAITTKEIDRADFDQAVDSWIRMWTEDREGHAVACVRVDVKESRTVPPNDKRRREVTYGIVAPVLRIDGQERAYDAFPLFLILVDRTWKLSVRD